MHENVYEFAHWRLKPLEKVAAMVGHLIREAAAEHGVAAQLFEFMGLGGAFVFKNGGDEV